MSGHDRPLFPTWWPSDQAQLEISRLNRALEAALDVAGEALARAFEAESRAERAAEELNRLRRAR